MNVSLISATAVVSAADDAKLRTLHSQPSFVFATKEVEVAVTRFGGHMAPVTFFRDSAQAVQPYHISPWQDEKHATMPAPVLVTLRGDFFCLPFGGNSDEVAGEKHPPHGEIVAEPWKVVGTKKEGGVTTLTMRGIVKSFPGVQAWRGVNLNLHTGEVLSLIGEIPSRLGGA